MSHNATYFNSTGSYESIIYGFSQMREDRDRETKYILVPSSRQYNELKSIEEIDPVDLMPWGRLPHPDTQRFIWQRRSPEGLLPEVWYRINHGSRDVMLGIKFSRHDHAPIESWEHHRTCDAEAVRAAIQQDYLNRRHRIPHHASIVKPGMKSLPLCSWDEFKNNPGGKRFKLLPMPSFAREQGAYDAPRLSASTTAAWVQMHAPYAERRQYRPRQS